jgi:hypothetical protein
MTSQPPTTGSVSAKISARNLEMTFEKNEIIHKQNLANCRLRCLQAERAYKKELDKDMAEERKRQKKLKKIKEKEAKDEKKKMEKEKKRMDKEMKKMEEETERDMGKKGDCRQRSVFCWAV